MTEKLNYISDAELEQLIAGAEQEELVAAPPDLMESILEAAELVESVAGSESLSSVVRETDFRAYCIRVITSVAAAVALVFLLPELTDQMNLGNMPVAEIAAKSDVVEPVPVYADVVKAVPDKAEVVSAKPIPRKAEVLDDTGFFEKVISNTADWLKKEKTSNEF